MAFSVLEIALKLKPYNGNELIHVQGVFVQVFWGFFGCLFLFLVCFY